MRSPVTALMWEIWQRGRRSAALILVCIVSSAFLNPIIPHDPGHELFLFSAIFGILMVLSFAFLLGLLNCTEFNSTRDWNGFPYRLFVLPVPTWKLVAVPMLLGLILVEVLFFAWVNLVWTHGQIDQPKWYAVVLGAYFACYQMTLWSLAGFRVLRTIALSIGGVSGVLVAFLPAFGRVMGESSPWLSEKRMVLMVLTAIPIAFLTAWIAVSRQRHSGGRRRNWFKALIEWLADRMPRRKNNFPSRAAAQFWFEWRQTGLLLPAAVGFVLIAVIAPLSWQFGREAHFTTVTICWIIALPVLLGTILGKGLAKPDFYSRELSVPSFLAARPMSAIELVTAKLKVAALSALITWFSVAAFLALWWRLWAKSSTLEEFLFVLRILYPKSWHILVVFCFIGLIILTWRCMTAELWSGLSGKRSWYFGSISLQVIVPLLVLLACAIWSHDIDDFIKLHPLSSKSAFVQIIGWLLAAFIIGRMWLAVWLWSRIDPRSARRYLIVWAGGTLLLITLAILAGPPMDTEREHHIYLLLALLCFPLARVGAAPRSLEKNRAR